MSRNVQLIIAFIGTRYEGWQSQRNKRTIQEVFERILEKICGEKTTLHGSSRTDSGVHAKAFSAHFHTKSKIPDSKLVQALNYYLPRDIVVLKAKTVSANFHARFHARSKIYQYAIWNHSVRPVFEEPYFLWHAQRLNVAKMKKAAAYLKGKHDFKAFQDRGDERSTTVRTIKNIQIKKVKERLILTVEGDGFLRHMIRVIAGTLIEVGRGRFKPELVCEVLRSKNRLKAGPTAKACGLTLVKVNY